MRTLTVNEVARRRGVVPEHIYKLVKQRRMPPPIRRQPGKGKRGMLWPQRIIDAWAKAGFVYDTDEFQRQAECVHTVRDFLRAVLKDPKLPLVRRRVAAIGKDALANVELPIADRYAVAQTMLECPWENPEESDKVFQAFLTGMQKGMG